MEDEMKTNNHTNKNKSNHANTVYSTFAVLFYINRQKIKKNGMCPLKRITYPQSRHNFGTLITLSRGVPLETVSQMMGHKCIRTTQIYAKMTRQKVNEDVKKISDRIGRKYKMPAQSGSKTKKNNAK